MIITLIKADFSVNNIGTLNNFSILTNLGAGAAYNGPISVTRENSFNATITLSNKYEFADGITIIMNGTNQSFVQNDNLITIDIPVVTGNIIITVPTVLKANGEIPNCTFTINPDPASAAVTLSATGYSTVSGIGSTSITVASGTVVNWKVTANGYTGQSGTWIANGANESKSVALRTIAVDGSTTWYVDHRDNASKFSASVNIAGRGWCHTPSSPAYEAYVGKPVNTIGFFTTKASQEVTISKVIYNGDESTMTEIATVTLTNPSGTAKAFCSATFPTVTLVDGECLAVFTQENDDIQFYYQSSSGPVTDANGIADGQFIGRVPKVYGSGTAWTAYDNKLSLGMSVGYNSEIA